MLIKNELATIPLLPVPGRKAAKDGRVDCLVTTDFIELPRSGVVMVADIFSARNDDLLYRFFSDGKTYYTCCNWPNGKWGKSNPAINYWMPVRSHSCQGDVSLAESFLHKKASESWRTNGVLAVIDAFISDKQDEKRSKAEERKEALRKAHFAMYPPLPNDLQEYCDNNVFEYGYIFFDKLTKSRRRYGKCGSCGKKYRIPADVRQNQETVCPHCGQKSQYKAAWRVKCVEERAKICITAKVHDQLLIRWIDVIRVSYEKTKSYTFVDYAYNLYLLDQKNGTLYSYEYKTAPYCNYKEWYRLANGSQNYSTAYIYTNNLNEVFGNRYYNVDMKSGLEGKRIQICFTSLLNSLKQYPAAEYLFKLNMPLLAEHAASMTSGKDLKKPGFSEVLGISKQYLPMYNSMNVSYEEHMIIKSYGAWVSKEDLSAFRSLKIETYEGRDLAKNAMKTMSFGKFVRYFGKQMQITKKSAKFLMIQHRDYLDMAKDLKIDLSRKAVRFPSNVCDAHDAVLKEFNRQKFEAENAAFIEAVTPIYARLAVKEFENEKYCIVLPQLRTDLIAEGTTLRHCVGGSGYRDNHMKGIRMIFFIRKKEQPERPYFTMEIDMQQCRIVQIHGAGNCTPPKEVRDFANSFTSVLRHTEDNKKGRQTA